METRNDIPNLLAMYIRNTREITWLQNCIIKHTAIKQEKQEAAKEHLTVCNTPSKNANRRQNKVFY